MSKSVNRAIKEENFTVPKNLFHDISYKCKYRPIVQFSVAFYFHELPLETDTSTVFLCLSRTTHKSQASHGDFLRNATLSANFTIRVSFYHVCRVKQIALYELPDRIRMTKWSVVK